MSEAIADSGESIEGLSIVTQSELEHDDDMDMDDVDIEVNEEEDEAEAEAIKRIQIDEAARILADQILAGRPLTAMH